MLIESHPPDILITTSQQPLEYGQQLTYLSRILSEDGSIDADVKHRTSKASAVLQHLQPIWPAPTIDKKTKLHLYKAIIVPTTFHISQHGQ